MTTCEGKTSIEEMAYKKKVAVIDDRFDSYEIEAGILEPLGAELEVHPSLSREEAPAVLKNTDAVLMNCFDMNETIIYSMEKCGIISRYGVGTDNVDIQAASKKGIWVSNVPDYASEDVSDHAFALLLACVRKITYKDRMIRSGRWNVHQDQKSRRIRGKTLGIIGHGNIGKAFHRKTASLGLNRTLVWDPYISPAEITRLGGTPASLRMIFEKADYISIHVPLSEETRHFIGREEFSAMKNDVILINTSRGPVIDEEAAAWALETGEIGYAGLDVFETEPLPESSPLKTMDNVILSDHAGWYNVESVMELKRKAAENIASYFETGKPVYPVNKVGQP